MSGVHSTVVYFMLQLGVSQAMFHSKTVSRETTCTDSAIENLKQHSTVFANDAGGILTAMATVEFDDGAGNVCVAQTSPGNRFTRYTVRMRTAAVSAVCCSAEENEVWVHRSDDSGRWHDTVFGETPQSELGGVSFYEVEPPICTTSTRCPLVIELGGGQSIPEAVSLYWCEECKQLLKVVMVGMLLGSDFDTSQDFVTGTFLPWAESYIAQSTTVDSTRVYLTSTSRGNQVTMQAALLKPQLFSWAVLTGKFHTSEMVEMLKSDADCFSRAAQNGLNGILFHLGDSDAAITDEEFYPDFASIMQTAAQSSSSPIIHVFDYPSLPHDITFTTWQEMWDVLWTAESSDVDR